MIILTNKYFQYLRPGDNLLYCPIKSEEVENMIDLNIKGVLYISRLVIPIMVEAKKGHVINIGSIAGKEVYPNGGTYCASKAAVESLSKGMRYDLLPYGIKVSNIAPGAVETEFSLVRFKGNQELSDNVYKGLKPKPSLMSIATRTLSTAVLALASL